jgi:hypothetical protein
MGIRVGIELSPTACRIVELEASGTWLRRPGDTRVRSSAVLPASGSEMQSKLAELRHRRAAVVVWGGRTEHRRVVVTAGSYESMRAEAMAALSATGVSKQGMWADIAIAHRGDIGPGRRTVVLAIASAPDMADALRPVREAGIRLRAVMTPAVALSAIARRRPSAATPTTIEPYVALDEHLTCVALMRQGTLLAARDLPWGFVDAGYAVNEPRSGNDMATRLAEAIDELVVHAGGKHADIGKVGVCGGLPDLRSMSATLMEQLDVNVEPLDSSFSIDAARLPEPADRIRECGAELQLACAAATEWPPVINLLRARRRHSSKLWLSRAAVAAGAAVGVSGSWWVAQRTDSRPGRRPVPSPMSVARPRVGAPSLAASEGATVDTGEQAPQPAALAPLDAAAPAAAMASPIPPEPLPLAKTTAREDKAEPFDAALTTILFSQDRRLAIIDDRVVGIGDRVRGATVMEITAAGVTLRDAQGREKQLLLGPRGR